MNYKKSVILEIGNFNVYTQLDLIIILPETFCKLNEIYSKIKRKEITDRALKNAKQFANNLKYP